MKSPIVHRSVSFRPPFGFASTWASLLGMVVLTTSLHAQFASEVVQLNLGVPGPLDFETKKPFDIPESVLGGPASATQGEFSAPVDPFSPPYQRAHLLSLGEGGQLTVKMAGLIQNQADHPFGLDFTIFGNSGFIITNGDFSGGGITSGDQFGVNTGKTVVSVSADGVTFYALDPLKAPVVDSLFPSDAQGNPLAPVNPSLTPGDFAGLTLEGIRKLYAGAWGGVSYDLSWAVDAEGNAVNLDQAQYIRVEVLEGRAEIDAFALVMVPEPSAAAMVLVALGCVMGAGVRGRRR